MEPTFFSTGQAARQLGITQDRVRQLCEAGAVTAEITNGGQWRIAKPEIDRLKRDGLPPVPRPLPGDSVRRTKSSNGLLAPPSPAVVSAAEDLAITENLLRQRRLELELAQVEDEFDEREQAETEHWEERERAEQARMAEEEAERLRRKRDDRWLGYALRCVPAGAEGEEVKIHAAVRAALAGMDVTASDGVVRPVVDGIVARSLKPWRRRQQADELASDAITSLPFDAKGWSWNPTTWEIRAKAAAREAVLALGDSAGAAEMKIAAERAVRNIAMEFEAHTAAEADKELRERLVRWASLPAGLTDHGTELARQAIADALVKLPQGTPQLRLEAARDQALAPFHEAVAEARRRQAEQEARAREEQRHKQVVRQDQEMRKSVISSMSFLGYFPLDLSAEERQKAVAFAQKIIDELPEGTGRHELEQSRDRAVAPFLAAHTQRKKKLAQIEGGLREIFPYLLQLEDEWEFDKGRWELERELKEPIHRQLAQELTGDEKLEDVQKRVRRLVREKLEI